MSTLTLPSLMASVDDMEYEVPAVDLDDCLPRLPLDDETEWEYGDPTLSLYRGRTVATLRRFLRLSLDAGRVPSLLGREFFRSHVSYRKAVTFEDVVIFVHDVERALEKLDELSKKIIARVVLQEYNYAETARLIGCCQRTVQRRYPYAIDRLSEIFLEVGLLQADVLPEVKEEKTCQE